MSVVGGSTHSIVLNDDAWRAVELLVEAGFEHADAIGDVVVAAGDLRPGERRGVRVALSRALFHAVTDALGNGAVTYQSIHELAVRAYPDVAAAVRLDIVEVEHLLRQPFRRSTWPAEELVFDQYVGLAASTLSSLLRVQGKSLGDLRNYRAQIERWLEDEEN